MISVFSGRWPNEGRISCISSTCRGTPPTPPFSWKCSMQKRDSFHAWMGRSNVKLRAELNFDFCQFASDSGWGAWKDWVKSGWRHLGSWNPGSLSSTNASLHSFTSSCSSSRCHMFASCVRVQIVLNIWASFACARIRSHICLHV